MSGKHGAGKGDRYRPVDRELYEKNWKAAFGKKQTTKRKANLRTRPTKGNAGLE